MPVRSELIWPAVDKAAICNDVGRTGPGTIDITTGTLYNSQIPNQISFIDNGFIRTVSVTAASTSASGIDFIINGLQNGAFVTDTISGPAANSTVYGSKYFDIITSVTVSNSVSNVSVGTGRIGLLPLIETNTSSTNSYINYSCSVIPSSSTINYSLKQTLENVFNNWIPLQNQESTVFFDAMGLTSETTSQIGNSTAFASYFLLIINSSTNDNNTLKLIFVQA